MPFQKLQPRRGSMLLYIVLLVVALGLMLSARQCSTSRIGLPPDMTAGGDTLNVAIEISPTSLSLAGDTLSGAYYNLLRQTCASHNLPVRFHPYTRLEDALQWLSEGRCRLPDVCTGGIHTDLLHALFQARQFIGRKAR